MVFQIRLVLWMWVPTKELPERRQGTNGTASFEKCKQLFEYQHLLLLKDIWWPEL